MSITFKRSEALSRIRGDWRGAAAAARSHVDLPAMQKEKKKTPSGKSTLVARSLLRLARILQAEEETSDTMGQRRDELHVQAS